MSGVNSATAASSRTDAKASDNWFHAHALPNARAAGCAVRRKGPTRRGGGPGRSGGTRLSDGCARCFGLRSAADNCGDRECMSKDRDGWKFTRDGGPLRAKFGTCLQRPPWIKRGRDRNVLDRALFRHARKAEGASG